MSDRFSFRGPDDVNSCLSFIDGIIAHELLDEIDRLNEMV